MTWNAGHQPNAPVLLDIRNLHVVRGQGDATFKVRLPSLLLAQGEVAAIVGESGCGKSTLLEALGLLLAPQKVDRFLLGAQGHNITQAVLAQQEGVLAALRAQKLGFVLQNGGLLPYLSVRENIGLPRRLLGMSPSAPFVDEAVQALRLGHLLDSTPSALSIGERQRVACVRALAHEPQVLLADEPTAALDPGTARVLFELLLTLVARLQLSAIIVSHDWSLVREFGLTCYQAHSVHRETCFERQV